ncbi:hypothetical protein [Mycolicibacterium sphagni]|nr:hypothetical protein [Mycolicibacterium sphagni]MCV7178076.1 hypothetical protein [Mycolicibacterium sphagni]
MTITQPGAAAPRIAATARIRLALRQFAVRSRPTAQERAILYTAAPRPAVFTAALGGHPQSPTTRW